MPVIRKYRSASASGSRRGVSSLHNFAKSRCTMFAGVFARSRNTGFSGTVSLPPRVYVFPEDAIRPATATPIGPYDFATIYNVLPQWIPLPVSTAPVKRIAIVGRTNINVQDVRDFRTCLDFPPNDPQDHPERSRSGIDQR